MLPDMDVDVLESRRKEIQRELALIGDLAAGGRCSSATESAASPAATALRKGIRGTGRTGC